MQIIVKLYGEMKTYAPGDRSRFTLELEPGATLGDVHRMLAVPENRHVALINGLRSESDASFAEGDTLVLMPLISGG